MANLRPFLVGRGPARPIQNINQPNLWPLGNQANQLINVPLLRHAQLQAADPTLIKILTQMQQPTQRS